jgi:hypothetical protein
MIGFFVCFFLSPPKTEKAPMESYYILCGGVEENSWGGCCFARFFPWGSCARRNGWRNWVAKWGEMAETLTSSTVWMKHDANKVRLQLDGVD